MRKYLDDIGVKNRPDKWDKKGDKRKEKWKEQRKLYGFDERETWCLNLSFYLWLYEHLKMFLEVNCIDLNYHKFEYKGKKYTQKQMIDMMIERLEFSFKPEYNDLDKEQYGYVSEIEDIWATVMPAMWW